MESKRALPDVFLNTNNPIILIGAYFLIAIKNTSSAKFVKPSEVIISVTSIGPHVFLFTDLIIVTGL